LTQHATPLIWLPAIHATRQSEVAVIGAERAPGDDVIVRLFSNSTGANPVEAERLDCKHRRVMRARSTSSAARRALSWLTAALAPGGAHHGAAFLVERD
jgi:hypothetical protein